MKKIVALGAIAALACGMAFADEPAIDIKVAELSGSASVKWGVDLDAGQHGFSNEAKSTLKINLWNEGTKETTADDGNGDVWAEIQVKGKGCALKATDGGKTDWDGDRNVSLEKAKIHFGDFYVDIKSGDLKHGEYKPDVAIHGDNAWLKNFGFGWSNGIEAGYDAEAFKFSLGFRSMKADKTDYTSCYGIKIGAELKDNLVPGLTASANFDVNLSSDYKDAESTGVEGYTDKADNLAKHKAKIVDWDKGLYTSGDAKHTIGDYKNYRGMGYSLKAAYKLAIGEDGMYLKPSIGFRGEYDTATVPVVDKAYTKIENELAFGVLFGWGDQKDANAGVPFLNADSAKKVTPGVSVAAYIPLPTVSTTGDVKTTSKKALQAVIVPSFYLGEDKVEGLKAAAYSEIGLYKYTDKDQYVAGTTTLKSSTTTNIEKQDNVLENETFAFALAAGLAYGIKVEDYTITPSAGFRYANGAYVSNGLAGDYSTIFKSDLGFQTLKVKDNTPKKQKFAADFFNLKIGCDFAGFINNTTFSVNYNSANLLNAIGTEDTNPTYEKDTKYYNVKAGQFDVGCKISL